MNKRYVLVIVLFIIVKSVCSSPKNETLEKINVTKELYENISTFSGEGIPTYNDIVKIKHLLTVGFLRVLRKAYLKQCEYDKQDDEPKPPLLEGCIFTSVFEGYTYIKSVWEDTLHDNSTCVEFVLVDTVKALDCDTCYSTKEYLWVDRVILKRVARQWLVDDIELIGQSEFNCHGRLKSRLERLEVE